MGDTPQSITFHYLKTQSYRTVHADGVFGGPTPEGNIYLAFYLERGPVPLTTTVELYADGHLGKEIERTGREGVVREFDVGVVVSVSAAKQMRQWLDSRIKEQEQESDKKKKGKG